jgi:outer membrane protein
MTQSRRAVPLSLAAALACAAMTGGLVGCVQDPMPFDPRAAQQWERDADAQSRTGHLDPLPTTEEMPFEPGEATSRPVRVESGRAALIGPPTPMSLQEVVHRAVANNLDIRVASFDTAIDQTRVLQAEAAFDPTFFSDINFQRVDKQVGGGNAFTVVKGINLDSNNETQHNASVFTAFISRVDEEALTNFDAGIRQNLAAGGKVQFEETVANSWFYPARSLYNPYYENDLMLSLTQPLLQNFGVAVNEAQITVARNTQRISLLDFRKTVEDTVLKLEQTYWQLLQAQQDVETEQRLVRASEATAERLFNQQRAGQAVSAAEVDQANAQTEARRVDLITAQNQVATLSVQLKVLMNDPAYPVSGGAIITPTDKFLDEPLQFNLDDLIETALENRLELGQQQVRVDSSEIAVDVARNGLLPSLTLQAEYTLDGLARTLQGAFNNQEDFNHNGFQLGLQFQMAIGNRAARAVWQRSLLQRMQAIAGYGSEVEKVTADVKTAVLAVKSGWLRLRAAHNAKLHYEKLFGSLEAQINSGNQALDYNFIFNLLQDQEQMAAVERAEHSAQNDYIYAIAQLENAKGTTLRYNNVVMEQEQLPFDLHLAGQPDPRPVIPGYNRPDRTAGPLGQ